VEHVWRRLERRPTGLRGLDRLLGGGFHAASLNTIYGEPTTGKTTLCLTFLLHHLASNPSARAYYLDVDNKLNTQRLLELAGPRRMVLPRLNLYTPDSFQSQGQALESLPPLNPLDVVVVDSATGLYRGEVGEGEEVFRVNQELNWQLALLVEQVSTSGATALATGQVRTRPGLGVVEPVSPRLLRYWSATLLRLERGAKPNTRYAFLEKPQPARKPIILTISGSGLTEETP